MEVMDIITSVCLAHSDKSPNEQARDIMKALRNNGCIIVKSDDQSEIVSLPTPLEDEGFIEQEISYQHHGVVRAAIINYKIFLKQRMDKKGNYILFDT